jgi:hypothetical protein
MAAVTINLDADVEARVSRYADGIGVPLEDLCERAVIFALTTIYPDNELPDGPFDPEVDNELPEGEIPTDPDYGVEEEGEAGTKPVKDRNPNLNPDLDPNLDRNAPRPGNELPGGKPETPDNELPEAPEPKY